VKQALKVALFQCSFIYSGGGERIVLEEARELLKRGYEVEIYAPAVDQQLCYPEFLKDLKVKTFLPQLPRWFPLRHAFSMLTASLLAPLLSLKFRDIDFFFSAGQPSAWIAFCCAKILNRPFIAYLNQPNRLIYMRQVDKESQWQTEKSYYFLGRVLKSFKWFLKQIDKSSFLGADVMLVNGAYMAGVINDIYGRKPLVCCAGAYYQPLAKLRLSLTTAYKGTVEVGMNLIPKPFILITNRHEPQKKFEYVIRAMKKVLKEYPDVFLVIPGIFTSHTPKLLSLARRLSVAERVLFLGQISEEDLQKLYQQAAVYCYPAPEEDFGLGPLEAGGWGVPTVAWNNAGPTATVENGITGFLAKPFVVKDYAEKILRLLKNPRLRSKMGQAAWQRVKEEFTWQKHIDILEKEMKKIRKKREKKR